MASTYYDSSGKEVVDGNVAYAADLNDINSAIDTGFQQVESDITAVSTNQSYYADLAEKWAENPEDTAVVPGQYSALHWAAKAADDKVLTAADVVQTGLDRVATAADRVNTNNDKIATAADRVQTGLDRVATAADRVQTGLDVVAAAGSASDASDYADAAAISAALFPSFTSSDIGKSIIVKSGTDLFLDHSNRGFKNFLINSSFNVWQRGTIQTSSGYGSDDRWVNSNTGSSKSHSRQTFSLGQTSVLGNPKYFSRTVVTSSIGASNFVSKSQRIERVSSLSGGKATLSFYAYADAPKNIAVELVQNFGTTGSPSASVTSIGSQLVALTANWQKISLTIDVPSISDKTLGSDDNDYLELVFWFDAGSSFNTRSASLGQQSGTFNIAQVQLEEGEIATEFEKVNLENEFSICKRFYETGVASYSFRNAGASGITTLYCLITYTVLKRGIPAITLTNWSYFSISVSTACTSISTIGETSISAKVQAISLTNANGFNNGTWIADAEL